MTVIKELINVPIYFFFLLIRVFFRVVDFISNSPFSGGPYSGKIKK